MTTCTICSRPTVGTDHDNDACCATCAMMNFPPPPDHPVPWWEAVRGTLAPRRDGLRALARPEDPTGG